MRSVGQQGFGHRQNGRGSARARRGRLGLTVLLVGSLLAACGSDDDKTAATSPASTPVSGAPDTAPTDTGAGSTTPDTEPTDGTVAPPTGDPIKVMATGTIESAAFSLPTIPLGAQIAVDEINAAGGINGRPLELVVCNDELDPNKASPLRPGSPGRRRRPRRRSVRLRAARVPAAPDLGHRLGRAATSSDFSTPILFPVGADGATAFAGIGAAAIETGCKNPAVLISATGSPANTAAIKAGIEMEGGTVAVELQTNGPDLAPLVESALAEGADSIASGVSPAETGALVAAQSKGDCRSSRSTDRSRRAWPLPLGSAADGIHVVSGFRLPAAGDPNVVALAEKSLAINPDAPIDHFWITRLHQREDRRRGPVESR